MYKIMQCQSCGALIVVSEDIVEMVCEEATAKLTPAGIISRHQNCCKKHDYIFNPWCGTILKVVETLAEGGS